MSETMPLPEGSPTPKGSAAPAAKLDQVRDQVGTMSDAECAKLAGVSVAAVKAYRKFHSIEPFAVFGTRPASLGPKPDYPPPATPFAKSEPILRGPMPEPEVLMRRVRSKPVKF